MPDLLFRLGRDGQPLFKEFAAAIVPTEFAPGKTFGTGTMQPIDYCVALAEGRIEPPREPRHRDDPGAGARDGVQIPRPAVPEPARPPDWQARGFTETLVDFAALNARSKFWGDDGRAAFKNWEEVADPRNPLGRRQGVDERIMLRELLRRVDMMVMLENRLDALVRLHTPFPPGRIGGAYQPGLPGNLRPETFYGPNAGLTEVLIPAGYVTTVYDPVFALSPDGTRYVPVPSRHADDDSRAGLALLAGVPGRAGPRGRPPEDRLGVRSGLEAPRAAARLRASLEPAISSRRSVSTSVPSRGSWSSRSTSSSTCATPAGLSTTPASSRNFARISSSRYGSW